LGRPTLSESKSKQLLAAWGAARPREHLANSAEAAVKAEEQPGFPVVLELDSPDILHKTEAGVVRLNLRDAAQVRTAYAEILASGKAYLSALPLDGSLDGGVWEGVIVPAIRLLPPPRWGRAGVGVNSPLGPRVDRLGSPACRCRRW
jgi:acyl-CoA synthetase (NDP forming)